MTTTHVEWPDIGFVVTMTHAAPAPCVTFQAWEMVGITTAGTPVYWARGEPYETWTTDQTQAQVFVSGSITGEGCGHLRFDAQDAEGLHLCGLAEACAVGALLVRLYDLAATCLQDAA